MSSPPPTAPPESTADIPKSKSASPKKKKRKRNLQEQLQEEQADRFKKLMHQAQKHLHKHVKQVKAFHTLKRVRKLKVDDEGKSNGDDGVLEKIKSLSIDRVVHVCLRRLGIYNLAPVGDEEKQAASDEEEDTQTTELIETILRHKRLTVAMEEWNQKVTEYRRWYLRRQDAVDKRPEFRHAAKTTLSKKKKKRLDTSSALFVNLGGEEEPQHPYGPAGNDFEVVPVRKNRQGQRARKAKALAVQAKKEGRTLDKSLNWRQRKEVPVVEAPKQQQVVPTKPEVIATMGKTWKEEGQAHPSWAARATEKKGIVEFKGTKITF